MNVLLVRKQGMRLTGLRLRAAVAIATTALLAVGCGAAPPPKMDDYRGNGIGQAGWEVGRQMYWVVGVPTFTQPVRIRSVELRPLFGSGPFDRPDGAYLLVYYGSLYYNGLQLGYKLNRTVIAGSHRQPLDSIPIQKLNNQLSIVIPVNIHQRGCHQAQLVFHVTTSDGQERVYPARWYVTLDTGVSTAVGDNECARPRHIHRPSPSTTKKPA